MQICSLIRKLAHSTNVLSTHTLSYVIKKLSHEIELGSHSIMAAINFEFKGKQYSLLFKNGTPRIPSNNDKAMEAFECWLKTDKGKHFFRYAEDDGFDSEHYLSDKHPVTDRQTGVREDEDDIQWCDYRTCSHGCELAFWYSGEHDCCLCGAISCKQCSKDSGCKGCTGCGAWMCDRHQELECSSCRKENHCRGNRGGGRKKKRRTT